MCGIVAVVTNSPYKTPEIAESLLNMARRGPDSEGEWVAPSGKVKLGHRRLSIIDLSDKGQQPMHNEDKSIWLVCNGEIYNYPNLRVRLEGLGHSFYSNSDSEVILHAYEQWDDDCVNYLIGMFAFSIWDENKKLLFAARDRIGIKPLCYAKIPGGIALSSDFSGLLPLLPESPYPDAESVAYVMTLGYIPAPHAIWKGTYKLEPGHKLSWNEKSGLQIIKYWDPPIEVDNSGDYSIKKWEELFSTVLHDHLLSDVPLSFFLSGGLDSTSIAVGLHHLNVPVKALTVSFPGSQLNEETLAKDVTKHLNQEHEIRPIDIHDIDRLLDDVATAYDEPIGYSALLTMYVVSELAAREFKVVLAGDGGDECFGGYVWHRANLSKNHKVLSLFLKLLRQYLGLTGHSSMDRLLASLYTGPGLTALQQYSWNVCSRFLPEDTEYLMTPAGLQFNDEKWIKPLARHFVPSLPQLRALQRIDLMSFCSDCILPKVDRASMWHSLEVRVPFLDHRIIEWSLRKPVENRELSKEFSKPILRDYLKKRVPQQVLSQPKQGFSLKNRDQYDWNKIYEQVDNSWWVQNGFWRKDWHKIIANPLSTKNGRFWFLLMLTKWSQKWL